MADVRKRVLGKSGIEVSPLGLGCMGLILLMQAATRWIRPLPPA